MDLGYKRCYQSSFTEKLSWHQPHTFPSVWLAVLTGMLDKSLFKVGLPLLLGYQPDAEVCMHIHIIASIAFPPQKHKGHTKHKVLQTLPVYFLLIAKGIMPWKSDSIICKVSELFSFTLVTTQAAKSCVQKTCIPLPYTAARLLVDSSHKRQQFSYVIVGQEDSPGKENIFLFVICPPGLHVHYQN